MGCCWRHIICCCPMKSQKRCEQLVPRNTNGGVGGVGDGGVRWGVVGCGGVDLGAYHMPLSSEISNTIRVAGTS